MADTPEHRSGSGDREALRSVLDKLDELSRLVAELSARMTPPSSDVQPSRPADLGDSAPPMPAEKKARRAPRVTKP